eukprot:scaffold5479_cov199-Amphora_coffeaeformis.AAC.76
MKTFSRRDIPCRVATLNSVKEKRSENKSTRPDPPAMNKMTTQHRSCGHGAAIQFDGSLD